MLKKIDQLIWEHRGQNGLLLRQVAAAMEMDQALLSKIERGERMPTKDQVIRLAKFYRVDPEQFLIAFLSDKLVYEVEDEEVGLKAIQVAEKKMNHLKKKRNGK